MKPLLLPSINLGIPTKTSSGIWRQRVHQEPASFRYNVHNGSNLDGRFGGNRTLAGLESGVISYHAAARLLVKREALEILCRHPR